MIYSFRGIVVSLKLEIYKSTVDKTSLKLNRLLGKALHIVSSLIIYDVADLVENSRRNIDPTREGNLG